MSLQEQLEEKWVGLSEELSELLQDLEEVDDEVTPFDATSDVSIDDQRQNIKILKLSIQLPAMTMLYIAKSKQNYTVTVYCHVLILCFRLECVRSIHESLHSGNSSQAAALLRAARDVWPDNDEFGAADISPEDEFMV